MSDPCKIASTAHCAASIDMPSPTQPKRERTSPPRRIPVCLTDGPRNGRAHGISVHSSVHVTTVTYLLSSRLEIKSRGEGLSSHWKFLVSPFHWLLGVTGVQKVPHCGNARRFKRALPEPEFMLKLLGYESSFDCWPPVWDCIECCSLE